jgi:phytoene desaturase
MQTKSPADKQRIAVIGAGFAGLSAAAYLAKAGYDVDIYEKNETVGGRARQLTTKDGYVFDMGPSWYWMPDVFEKFFGDFGYRPTDFYELHLLSPGFSIVFENNEVLDIPNGDAQLDALFESIEPGSSAKLKVFLEEAAYKYEVGMKKLVYKPGLSISEFIDSDIIKGVFRLQLLQSFSKHVKKHFKHPKLIALMEFPVLFLGATAEDTPALYSLMNYAGLKLGTWYPKGGFAAVIAAMQKVCEENGVNLNLNEPVRSFEVVGKNISAVTTDQGTKKYDGVIASADYHHVEAQLLGDSYRNYSEKYWESRTLAPSSLIFYLGVNKKVPKLNHHTLFFDEDLKQHAHEIYKDPQWPSKPLFYVCCTSKTDSAVAPDGHENLFLLMPLATGIEDNEALRATYFEVMMKRLEAHVGMIISAFIDYKKSYCIKNFVEDYHSYKGNAYGLANTLAQTANLKPSIKNKKISNLFYAGQLTVPGPGVPPSIISGKVAATLLSNHLNTI